MVQIKKQHKTGTIRKNRNRTMQYVKIRTARSFEIHGNCILTTQLSLALQRVLHSHSRELYSALSGTTTGTSFDVP